MRSSRRIVVSWSTSPKGSLSVDINKFKTSEVLAVINVVLLPITTTYEKINEIPTFRDCKYRKKAVTLQSNLITARLLSE